MSATETATVALPAIITTSAPANDVHRVLSPQFIRMVRVVHACGPRAVGELLMEVADRDDLALRLPAYAALDPALVDALDCRDFPNPVLAGVPGRRRHGASEWSSLGDVARRVVASMASSSEGSLQHEIE